MNARSFDSFARSVAGRLPRRRLLGRLGAVAAAGGLAAAPRVLRAQDDDADDAEATPEGERLISLPCVECNCGPDGCECCIPGITGGGVVRTDLGDVNFLLFATRLAEGAAQDATGFVRWNDPHYEGGMALESVGPITYRDDSEEDRAREVLGLMSVNGEAEEPFILRVFDAGDEGEGADTVRLRLGDSAADEGAAPTGFGYEAEGDLVGGDVQLLNDVAAVGQG